MSGVLEVAAVSKVFRAGGPGGEAVRAVDDVSLKMPDEPAVLSLVGESGSGKTTLARLILGLLRPTQGTVRVGDYEVSQLGVVGLDLSDVAGKYHNAFSGGQLQRLSVARALIPKPKLIVADEPVSALDASLRMTVVNLFAKLRDTLGISFVYVTHDLSTAYYISDQVAIMHRGKVVEAGAANRVLTRPEHDYTRRLVAAIPQIGVKWDESAPETQGVH